MKKFLSSIKRIVFKLCGKARWLVIAASLIYLVCLIFQISDARPYTYGVLDNKDKPIKKMPITQAMDFSMNSNGQAVVSCGINQKGCTAFININTGSQTYANLGVVKDNSDGDKFIPYNFAITDDNELYAVKKIKEGEYTEKIKEEYIVRINNKNKMVGEVFKLNYDDSESIRESKISRLHYYNGAVTFACIDKNEVTLYMVDTETQVVTKSQSYPTDENGTFTANIIPIDGSFLFIRSDGNVYNVKFDEPLGDSIYKVDDIIFTKATLVNGKIYVFSDKYPSKIFCLKEGSLSEAADFTDIKNGAEHHIISIDSYRPEGASEDVLALCFDDGLLTYSDGKITENNIEIRIDRHFGFYLVMFLEFLFYVAAIGIVINLIIRRKTLLYKQLIITIPVFALILVGVGYVAYGLFDMLNTYDIERELEVIGNFASREFDGYDFSKIAAIDEGTGQAYQELCSKLENLKGTDEDLWNNGYVFSIVQSPDEKNTYLVARDDVVNMPLGEIDDYDITDNSKVTDDLYIMSDNYDSFLDDYNQNSVESDIRAYCRISDASGNGKYFLKVKTDSKDLLYRRSVLFGIIILVFPLLFIVFISVMIANSLHVSRTIKKATATVKTMAEGDLTERVNYKSKDELGEICSQVNIMGQNLETMFEEKDKTEKFYYKFVPEKFRELLGKDNLTDLSLGDAISREITVLFCDIRSFSINSEMMTAGENFAFVNVIYGKAGPIIRENNGFIDKYIGDAIMALFESADDAVKCANELYRAIVLDPKTAEELKVSDINIGIGIHSGMAMIGIVGEEERLSGTVISDTVNLSSRLESLTKQYNTAMLVSKDTVDRLSDAEAYNMRYLGIIQVAGVNEVKAVYEVLDCMPDEEREKRSANSSEFREAMRLFQLGRRSDAASALQSIVDEGKNDEVTDMYLKYINEMSDDDKGNVFRFVRK
jgi:Adenylate cyclase, family 3 (some proteins contain HAMP domain)